MQTALGIAVAGGLGALARYTVDGIISRRAGGPFPLGTFVVNISGAFILGAVFVLLTERFSVPGWLRPTLTVGLMGGFTAFSTLSLETVRLLEDGAYGYAIANSAGSIVMGVVAVYVGMTVGRLI